MFQHIFDKNTIAFLRILHKHMSYRSNDLVILDDWASAHPLDDSSGGFQEGFVGDLQFDSSVYIIMVQVD